MRDLVMNDVDDVIAAELDLVAGSEMVLDCARKSPVTIVDSDGHRSLSPTGTRHRSRGRSCASSTTSPSFHAVWSRHRGEPPAQWATMTPFPFLAAFDADDVDEFSAELIPYLEESVRRRDLDGFLGNLRAWESSAETYGDEAMLAQMNVPLDPAKFVELSPPR
jgi:hypothetical protein